MEVKTCCSHLSESDPIGYERRRLIDVGRSKSGKEEFIRISFKDARVNKFKRMEEAVDEDEAEEEDEVEGKDRAAALDAKEEDEEDELDDRDGTVDLDDRAASLDAEEEEE